MKLIIFSLLSLLLLIGCLKNTTHPIPSTPFSISINLNLPSYNALNGVSGYCYVQGGIQGIIVYRRSIDEFYAFECKSPAGNAECSFPLKVNKSNFLQLDDSCTSAKFSLFDGSAISGSNVGLRQYSTQWNGSNILVIYN
jgi:hypothetical protein